jgi:mRNA-degrading endonuclease RelE of RelBE toxin-antitoxin system
MTYRVEFEVRALRQLKGIPPSVFDALVERVVDLVREPWDADQMVRGGDPSYRQVLFGDGYGLLSFRVDDATELISIFDLAWIG